MEIMGYDKYRIGGFSLLTDNNTSEYRIPSYNEFLFLVSKNLVNGTVIHSDISVYRANKHYADQVLSQVREFTGLIIIENPKRTVQLLEFIRVIPE